MKTLIIATLLTSSMVFAQQTETPKAQPRSSDKVDLKKLEDKYWSAKDEDYGVIQNRTFSKEGKFYVSGAWGSLINDPFSNSKGFGLFAGYYFTEDFGVEVNYITLNPSQSDSLNAYSTLAANIKPNYNVLTSYYNVSLAYTPFYAKMSFMNKAILYFDMGATIGLGMANYNQMTLDKDGGGSVIGENKVAQSTPQLEIGVMQQLFLSKNFAFRMDIKNIFYNSKILQYNVPNGQTFHPEVSSKTQNDTLITLGVTLFTN